MSRVPFGQGACEKIRTYLDSYISNELLVETNHEVLRHLETCPACSAEVAERSRLRNHLKSAVKSQPVPADLAARVRQTLEERPTRKWFGAGWQWSLAAAAAAIVLSVGVWSNYSHLKLPALTDRPAQDAYIQRISETIAGVLQVGLRDHVHCAVFRKYPKNPPKTEQMEADLGPEYKSLLPLVKSTVPKDYHMVMAHQCGYKGRRYVHFTFENNGNLISLVISRKKPGETLADLKPFTNTSGIPVYQSATDRYEIAGFETDRFLAFVVSDLRGKVNLQVATNLAPAVHAFLQSTPAA